MTSDPFKVAADLVRTMENLKPIGTRPAWRRAELLAQEMRREVMQLPDDFAVSDTDHMPALQGAGAGVTSTGSVTVRAGLKFSPPTEPTSAIENGDHNARQ